MKVIKKEIEIEEELKKKVEMICKFSNTTPTFENDSINKLENTNLAYLEPHKVYIKNTIFLIFNETNDIYLNNLNNKYQLKDLENKIYNYYQEMNKEVELIEKMRKSIYI